MTAVPTSGAFSVGVVGQDGRTDALAEKCTQSPTRPAVWALSQLKSPGLVARCGENRVSVTSAVGDPEVVVRWAAEVEPHLVIVGPEEPLARGVVDALTANGVACFGPVQSLARIESSKSWARQLVARHGVPGNPEYRRFDQPGALEGYARQLGEFVVKPDGLTGGKGVRVYPEHFESLAEAIDYGEQCIASHGKVLVEERLDGEEFSLMTITDGEAVVHCPPVQDHKRAYVDDTGPNTGGMGSYSCEDLSLPFLLPTEVDAARRINEQVVVAMASETGQPYRGVLYGGFMATAGGVRLIEYNCRFGDPEALNVLPIMECDFVEVAYAVATGGLSSVPVSFERKATVCKYVVPEGYPVDKGAGDAIEVPPELTDDPAVRVYWAAAELTAAGARMTGSRALGVVGIGGDLEEAEGVAEHAASRIGGPVRHRHDIGTPALVARRIEHMNRLRPATATS